MTLLGDGLDESCNIVRDGLDESCNIVRDGLDESPFFFLLRNQRHEAGRTPLDTYCADSAEVADWRRGMLPALFSELLLRCIESSWYAQCKPRWQVERERAHSRSPKMALMAVLHLPRGVEGGGAARLHQCAPVSKITVLSRRK